MPAPKNPIAYEEWKTKQSLAKSGPKNPNYGKHLSEEHRAKIGLANSISLLGKHHSEETRKKMSLAHKGEKHPLYGKHHSENTKRKISESRRGIQAWNKGKTGIYSPETLRLISESLRRHTPNSGSFRKGRTPWNKGSRGLKAWNRSLTKETDSRVKKYADAKIGARHPFYGKKHSPETRYKQSLARKKYLVKHPEEIERIREARLRTRLPRRDSQPELTLQYALMKCGISFRTQVCLLNATQCDLFIEPNIVIYEDGCWWHGCEKCFDTSRLPIRIRNARDRDILITRKLTGSGYRVLRFWEHEVNSDTEACVNKILSAIVESRFGSLEIAL